MQNEPDRASEEERSEQQLRAIAPRLAAQAAEAWRENAGADIVGIVADAGSLEARRCRTRLEQGTGIEFEPQGFAGVLTIGVLAEIVGPDFPPEILEWLGAGNRGQELRLVACTTNGFRVGAIPIPRAAPE